MLVLCLFNATTCSPPDDSDPSIIVGTNPCFDPWRNEHARIRSSIRFEAILDTSVYPLRSFAGSGLRVAVVAIPPVDTLPYFDLYNISADYLDIPAAGLPFEIEIPVEYFRQYDCARLAAAFILLHVDENSDGRFQPGESIVGAGEHSLYAFAQGDTRTISSVPFESVFSGNNVLIRTDNSDYPRFKSSPDYLATIFIINVRGPHQQYKLPYPWSVASHSLRYMMKENTP